MPYEVTLPFLNSPVLIAIIVFLFAYALLSFLLWLWGNLLP